MQKLLFFTLLGMTACAVPKRDLALDQLSQQWQQEATPEQRQLAPDAARDVDVLMTQWRTAESKSERERLAFLVEKKIAIFSAAAALATDRLELAQLEKDRIELERQISQQAIRRAEHEADRLRLQSLADSEAAERALEEAAAAEAARAQQAELTALAQAEAEAARKLSEATAREAELAKREAELRAAQLERMERDKYGIRSAKNERGLSLILGDTFFAPGQSQLSAKAKASLKSVIPWMTKHSEHPLFVEGHTDGSGPEAANQLMSEKRAQSVADALIELGIPAERVTIKGFGETKPLASNQNAAGKAQNRRVELILEGAE